MATRNQTGNKFVVSSSFITSDDSIAKRSKMGSSLDKKKEIEINLRSDGTGTMKVRFVRDGNTQPSFKGGKRFTSEEPVDIEFDATSTKHTVGTKGTRFPLDGRMSDAFRKILAAANDAQSRRNGNLRKASIAMTRYMDMSDEVIRGCFRSRGYQLKELGDNRIELKSAIRPYEIETNTDVRLIFDLATKTFQGANIYDGGKKIKEISLQEENNGERVLQTRVYRNAESNSSRDLVITRREAQRQ